MFEPLERQRIISSISPENRRNLAMLEIFDIIDSTNSNLLMQAKKNLPSGSVCLAEQQTQGRGRRGKSWDSPPGENIYCSMLWRFSSTQSDMSGLGLAVAVIVANTLQKYGIEKGVELKWPNDILFQGRKLAGILLESSDRLSVVIGIGLNVLSTPDVENAVSLAEIAQSIPVRNAVAGLLINELLDKLPRFEVMGLKGFLNEWRRYDVLFGKQVKVYVGDDVVMGIMRGVDEKGEMLVELENGIVNKFSSGEVTVRAVV